MKKVFKYIGPNESVAKLNAAHGSETIAVYDAPFNSFDEAIYQNARGEYVAMRSLDDTYDALVGLGRYETLAEAVGALARAGYDVSALRGVE